MQYRFGFTWFVLLVILWGSARSTAFTDRATYFPYTTTQAFRMNKVIFREDICVWADSLCTWSVKVQRDRFHAG